MILKTDFSLKIVPCEFFPESESIARTMFLSKLFLALALLLLAGQQLSAESAGNNSGASSSCVPPYDAYLDDLNNSDAKRDHANYVLINDYSHYFVGMGPVGRLQQHLQIIAIIAHLKAANEKPIYFSADTAQYETFADSLITGGRIEVMKYESPVTAVESYLSKTIILQIIAKMKMEASLGIMPKFWGSSLNYYAPESFLDLEHIFTSEKLISAILATQDSVGELVESGNKLYFDLETVEAMAASAITEFKQSQFNSPDFVNAKDVEKWVLRGTGQESIERICA